MPVDVGALAEDLDVETAELLAMIEPLDAAGWATPTPAPGWIRVPRCRTMMEPAVTS